MIETLSQELSKCYWFCWIILIAFGIESFVNHALVVETLSDYQIYGNAITLINNTLTGVVVLSIAVSGLQKLIMNQEENETDTLSSLSLIRLAEFKNGVAWAFLFKGMFVLLEYNINGNSFWKSLFSGWNGIYTIIFALIVIFFIIPEIVKNAKK